MSKATIKDVAQLFWGANSLWLGPWKAATVEPVWHSERVECAPDWWKWSIGTPWNGEGAKSCDEAMGMAELAVMGQLRAIGIRAAVVRRADGTVRKIEMP